jgi:hypothetical protein
MGGLLIELLESEIRGLICASTILNDAISLGPPAALSEQAP